MFSFTNESSEGGLFCLKEILYLNRRNKRKNLKIEMIGEKLLEYFMRNCVSRISIDEAWEDRNVLEFYGRAYMDGA